MTRRTSWFAVLALAVSASACGGSSSSSLGSLFLTWKIQSPSGTSCASVGASKVRLDVYYGSSAVPTTFEFPCDAGTQGGETTGLTDGWYSADISLVDASNNVLSFTTAMGPYYVERGYSTDIGDVVFQVAPSDQFFYVNWVIHKCADTACSYDLPGEVACPVGSTVVLTVDGVAYQEVDCNVKAIQTTTLTPGQHNVGIQLLGCTANAGGICSQFPGSGTYPITVQQGVPYGAQLIFAIQ